MTLTPFSLRLGGLGLWKLWPGARQNLQGEARTSVDCPSRYRELTPAATTGHLGFVDAVHRQECLCYLLREGQALPEGRQAG